MPGSTWRHGIPDQFPKVAQLEAINVPADTIIASELTVKLFKVPPMMHAPPRES